MSYDPESSSSSPSTSRDWFYPSPSILNTNSSSSTRIYKRPKRFTPNHKTPLPNFPPSKPHKPSNSLPHSEFKYASIRRRIDSCNLQKQKTNDSLNVSVVQKTHKNDLSCVNTKGIHQYFGGNFSERWNLGLYFLVVITTLSSLLYTNFSLNSQVDNLQEQVLKLNVRLQVCNVSDAVNDFGLIPEENEYYSSKSLKFLALVLSLTALSMPLVFYMYIDYVSKSLKPSDNILEEVSLNKQLEYRLDVILSVHPYAKPLALLVATLLLIFLGGLTLFGVTDDSLADCLWLSWTYVAASGSHTDSEGFGPRLVAVSVSFGGMLIFAMMLGLVSDAISEKFDSLRKGRSEVVEQHHTLILGWSDKCMTRIYKLLFGS